MLFDSFINAARTLWMTEPSEIMAPTPTAMETKKNRRRLEDARSSRAAIRSTNFIAACLRILRSMPKHIFVNQGHPKGNGRERLRRCDGRSLDPTSASCSNEISSWLSALDKMNFRNVSAPSVRIGAAVRRKPKNP
jgi:hypothetical protein